MKKTLPIMILLPMLLLSMSYSWSSENDTLLNDFNSVKIEDRSKLTANSVDGSEHKKKAMSAPKVPVLDKNKVEQFIYDKLRNYGNIRMYGFDRVEDEHPNICLKHKLIDFHELPYKTGKLIIAIASSSPEKHNDCHVCAPKLSFFEFTVENAEWLAKNSYINAIKFGSWGSAPRKEDIKVVALNPDKFGLLFDSSYSNNGSTEEMKQIYIFDNGKVKNIFLEIVGIDDAGARDIPKDSWKGSIDFNKNGFPLYDIVMHKKGLVNAKSIDEKIVYKYDGNKYIKQ